MKAFLFLISLFLFIFMAANCADSGETYPWQDAGGDIPTYDINFGDATTYDIPMWDFGNSDTFNPSGDSGSDSGNIPVPPDVGPPDVSGDINQDVERKDHGPDAIVEWDATGSCELFQDASNLTTSTKLTFPDKDTYFKNGSDNPSSLPAQNHFTPPKIDEWRWDNSCTDIGEAGSPDHIYKFSFTQPGIISILADCTATYWGFNCITYFTPKDGAGCALTQADITLEDAYCANEGKYGTNDETIKALVFPGDYYYIVDGYDGDSGEYNLAVDYKHFEHCPANSVYNLAAYPCTPGATTCFKTTATTIGSSDKFFIYDVPYTDDAASTCVDSDGAPDHLWAIKSPPDKSKMTASITKKGEGGYDLSVFIVLAWWDSGGWLCAPRINDNNQSCSAGSDGCSSKIWEDNWLFYKNCDYNFSEFTVDISSDTWYYVIVDGEDGDEEDMEDKAGAYELTVQFE